MSDGKNQSKTETDDDLALRIEIFELIDLARKLRGLSAYRLCTAAEIDQVTYSRLKRKPHAWRRDTVRKLIRALTVLDAIDKSDAEILRGRIRDLGKRAPYEPRQPKRQEDAA